MKKTHLLSVLALGISAACHAETYPAPVGPSQSDFGGVGLLQTPTARMAREGEMSLNYRDNDQYRYYSASVQLFPVAGNHVALYRCPYEKVQQRGIILRRPDLQR
ncbi:lipoprotein [Salmonella enterica subsp. enterica]|uniref:Lipoprotein n=1 Tax=Salmonella enterica I TaxID=59201 RepID=A0A3S4IDY6_SALET|nr:lipoprotein [Salmonella enterica subsp. enterica]